MTLNPSQFKSFEEFHAHLDTLPQEERIRAFDDFTEAYLLLRRQFGASRIWKPTDENLPPEIEKALKQGSSEISMIAEKGVDADGNPLYWAIRTSTGKDAIDRVGVDRFKAAAEDFSRQMLITDQPILPESTLDEIRKQNIGAAFKHDFYRLDETFFAGWDHYKTTGQLPPKERAVPRDYDQAIAVSEAASALESGDKRIQIQAPCGFGKTLTGLWITEEVDAERVIVFAPSLHLTGQTLEQWAQNANDKEIDAFCVCSDKSVGKQKKKRRSKGRGGDVDTLPVPVETDPDAFAKWWAEPVEKGKRKVCFATYQSAEVIHQGIQGLAPADFMLCDEAHRIAGPKGKDFQNVLLDDFIPAESRLFMTATPKIGQPSNGEVLSMDNPEQFGRTVYRMSFGEAIERGLLCDYEIEVVVTTNKEAKDLVHSKHQNARLTAQAIAVHNAMKEGRFHHAISFHHRIEKGADPFVEEIQNVANYDRGLYAKTISAETPISERIENLQQLVKSEMGVVASVNALTEGVDAPAVDAVIFSDPRSSTVYVVQGVGRALRMDPANPSKKAKIVIPVVVDEGEEPDAAMEGTSWKPVWDVIQAMSAHDHRLEEQIKTARLKHYRRRFQDQTDATLDPEEEQQTEEGMSLFGGFLKVKSDVPVVDPEVYASQIRLRTVEKDKDRFWTDYAALEAYLAEKGHCSPRPGETYKGVAVGAFAEKMLRRQRTGVFIPEEHLAALLRLRGWGQSWEDREFVQNAKLLREYQKEQGHASPDRDEMYQGQPLGRWVEQMKQKIAKLDMDVDKIEYLRSIPGWGQARLADWVRDFVEVMKRFHATHGHAWPSKDDEFEGRTDLHDLHRKLWERRHTAPEHEREALAEIPDWGLKKADIQYRDMTGLLARFMQDNGGRYPRRDETFEGEKLGKWFEQQMKLRESKEGLTEKRLEWFNNVVGSDSKFSMEFSEKLASIRSQYAAGQPLDWKLDMWLDIVRNRVEQGLLTDSQKAELATLREFEHLASNPRQARAKDKFTGDAAEEPIKPKRRTKRG